MKANSCAADSEINIYSDDVFKKQSDLHIYMQCCTYFMHVSHESETK